MPYSATPHIERKAFKKRLKPVWIHSYSPWNTPKRKSVMGREMESYRTAVMTKNQYHGRFVESFGRLHLAQSLHNAGYVCAQPLQNRRWLIIGARICLLAHLAHLRKIWRADARVCAARRAGFGPVDGQLLRHTNRPSDVEDDESNDNNQRRECQTLDYVIQGSRFSK